jgi:hypothetical protein
MAADAVEAVSDRRQTSNTQSPIRNPEHRSENILMVFEAD